jgi:hypothetical protein
MEDLAVNCRLLLIRDLKEMGCDSVDYIDLAKEREMWLDLVIALIKF